MNVTTEKYESSSQCDWLFVPISQLEKGIGKLCDPQMDGFDQLLSDLSERKEFLGKAFTNLSLFDTGNCGSARILLFGVGKPADLTPARLRKAVTSAVKTICKREMDSVQLCMPTSGIQMDTALMVEAMVSGFVIGTESSGVMKTEPDRFAPAELKLVWSDGADPESDEIVQAMQRGQILGESTNLTRKLVNLPAENIYPESFCERATELAETHGMKITVLDQHKMQEMGMGCILGVGKGSEKPPRMMIMDYCPDNAIENEHLFYVGKGITFDSGGLSLKSNDQMKDMKMDMGGSATVLAATVAIARLKLPIRLTCITAMAENMTNGLANKLGDVLTAKNGKTVEVLNTDAEGRLVLADALCHAVDLGATRIVDLATLTGSCMVALGHDYAGLMTNCEDWVAKVKDASETTGEPSWQLPMYDGFAAELESAVADTKNVGSRLGGASIAAHFLENFVNNLPWVHIDIAGPAWGDTERPDRDSGGTGYFVHTLVQLAESMCQSG